MGTTLTGTTPQDTYDSLIKVTDNGPISGTLKALSDGLGNDSTLSLSTTAASIAGTLAVTGNATFDTTTLFVDAASNEVGIGTSAPDTKLHVAGADAWITLQRTSGTTNIIDFTDSAAARIGYIGAISSNINILSTSSVVFGANSVEAGRFTSTGVLELAQGQIKFPATQVPSADPNTLDDYEEGEWTMGITFGGASVGVTYTSNTGTYTKIGRQVTVNGFITLSSKGSSVGDARVTGLPFTIPNNTANYSTASVKLLNVSFTNQFVAYGVINSTNIDLEEVTILGAGSTLTNADFANNSSVMVSLTYFV